MGFQKGLGGNGWDFKRGWKEMGGISKGVEEGFWGWDFEWGRGMKGAFKRRRVSEVGCWGFKGADRVGLWGMHGKGEGMGGGRGVEVGKVL